MKILLYTHGFAPVIGGAEKYVAVLAQGLSSRGADGFGVEVTVATPTPGGSFDDSQFRFKVVRRPNLLSLAMLIRRADVIQLAGPCFVPLLLGWILRRPIVIEHHGYTASCPNGLLLYEPTQSVCPGHFLAGEYRECIKCNSAQEGLLKSIAALFLSFPRRWLCRRVSLNTPITEHVKKRLALPNSRVIYYGIPKLTCASESTKADRSPRIPISFAYVGRLVPLKGLRVLLEAAKLVKNEGHAFRLKMIGDGPEREALERLAIESGLNSDVVFTGFATGDCLDKELADVSAVVMPSIWEETAGLAAIEQMMRGRLVIASDIGGLGEVVGECGLKCSPGDPVSLASCMKQVIEHPEIVDRIGAAARSRALSLFLEKRMVESHMEAYRHVAAPRRNHRTEPNLS